MKVKIRVLTLEGEGDIDWVGIAEELAAMSRARIEEQRVRKPPLARPPKQRNTLPGVRRRK